MTANELAVAASETGAARALSLYQGETELAALGEAPLEVTVRLGTVRLPLRELLDLRAGSVLVLERQVGEPAEIMVGDKVVALGQVVMVGNELGVRLTEVGGGL